MKDHFFRKVSMTSAEAGQNWSDEPLKDHEGSYQCSGCGSRFLVWDGETYEDVARDMKIEKDCELELVRRLMEG